MIQVQIQSDGTVVMWDHVAIIFYALWSWCITIPGHDGIWEGDGWWKMPRMIPRFSATPQRKFSSYFAVH